MEKNKGLFSFRKHPVGDFPDGEKGRKRKGGRLRRSMGFLLAAALVFNTLPASGLAVSASGREAGLCEHHRSHTADCGYMEAQPCTHEHTEECYKTVTECVHEHTDECYPKTEETEASTGEGNATASDAEGREPENCTHQCSEESGCITKVLDCHHEHDESCGYQEAQECGYVCDICNGIKSEDTENTEDTDTDTAKCICETLCTEDSINGDCPVCGAEGADLSACTGKEQGSAPEKDTVDDNAGTDRLECICETLCTEDSINGDCPVCGAEDADLSRCKGEKTEEQEKTGEKVITAWEWIDPEEYLTDGMLALPGAGRENPAFAEDVTALLPEKIQAEVVIVKAAEDEEETEEDAEAAPETEGTEITLTGWECASYPEDGAYEGTYTFTAFLPEGFVLAEDAAALEVKVELGGVEMLAETVSVSYQEASWDSSKVTYTDKTADSCTPVENSAAAVTWNAGWYVVNSTVTISEPITVTGAVNLILADDCTLDAQKGIVVTTDNSLTIYAQSGGTGTLNATGTTDSSNNASAGIGGSTDSLNSGAITIHGGVINATGGSTGSNGYGGAGIGGGTSKSANGGNSGTIIIYGGTVTANNGAGGIPGAGIGGGGGGGDAGGAGSNITIYGGSVTAASTGTQFGGAGIGGGFGLRSGGAGNNIQIYGGTINATGGDSGAGIGGGGSSVIDDSSHKSGDGAVTISGGNVTAVGGNYAAGIGGGGGYYYSTQYTSGGCTGGTGSVTISGGIVDASSPTDVYWTGYAGAPIGNGGNTTAAATVNKTTGIVFENGAGTVCGDVTLDGSYTVPADYTLNIPAGASLSGSGTLSGGSAFTTENLTADMISVPTDLYYTGKDRSADITTKLSAEMNKGIEICGQTFTVSGWTLAVEKTDDLTYTAAYTNNNDNTNTFTKTITLLKSGTKFEGDVKTYNGDTQTTTFNADDTITVKATPTATGTAPAKAAAHLRGGYTAPTAGQMALFVGDVQISEPVEAGADGTYTMTVSAAEVLLQGNAKPNGNAVTLTVKFVGNDNMADAAGTVDVKISAVAMAEKGGAVIGYYGESNLADAFAEDSGNDGATITLLDNITTSKQINVYTDNLTLDLNGKTYTCTQNAFQIFFVSLTIKGSGAITTSGFYCLVVDEGTLNIESGSFSANDYAVYVVNDGTLQLTGGSFTGGKNAIKYASGDVKDALKNDGGPDAPHYAFYQGSSPYTPSGRSLPSGTFTVQECDHTGVEMKNLGGGKHGLTCPYCGYHYEHTTTLTATASGNTVTLNGGCSTEGCGYQTPLGTASFTFPKVTYGQSGDVTCAWDGPTGYYGLIEVVSGNLLQFNKDADENIAEISLSLAQLFGSTKVTAGEHKLKISFSSDARVLSNACELEFKIDPAPLTADMVTLGQTDVTYNGTERKPALSVKQGETTLTEGTDYEVSYKRGDAATTDFTSAGAVKITVTGKGNYTGTVTKEYVIGKADVPAGNLAYTPPADLIYTGQSKTAAVTVNSLTGIGTVTVKYKKDNSGDLLAEAKEPGTYHVYADISAGLNYSTFPPIKLMRMLELSSKKCNKFLY